MMKTFEDTRQKPDGQDRGARIQFKRVHFGVFAKSRFAPRAQLQLGFGIVVQFDVFFSTLGPLVLR